MGEGSDSQQAHFPHPSPSSGRQQEDRIMEEPALPCTWEGNTAHPPVAKLHSKPREDRSCSTHQTCSPGGAQASTLHAGGQAGQPRSAVPPQKGTH